MKTAQDNNNAVAYKAAKERAEMAQE